MPGNYPFRIVEFRRRRRVHHTAASTFYWVFTMRSRCRPEGRYSTVADVSGDSPSACMRSSGLARSKNRRVPNWHLIDHPPPCSAPRNPVPGLDHCVPVAVVVATPAVLPKISDRDRIRAVMDPWSITFSVIMLPADRRRHLHAAGAPAIGTRHFTAGEQHPPSRIANAP